MQHSMSQPERFEFMLERLGMSAADFSRATHIREGTISNWRKGNRQIRYSSAKEIEKHFPQFSAAWLLGDTDHINRGDEIAAQHESSYLAAHEDVRGAMTIAGHVGYTVSLPMFNVRHDSLKQSLFDATNAGYRADGAKFIDVDTAKEKTAMVTIEYGNKTTEITEDEFREFAKELADFAAVRLSHLIKRHEASIEPEETGKKRQ